MELIMSQEGRTISRGIGVSAVAGTSGRYAELLNQRWRQESWPRWSPWTSSSNGTSMAFWTERWPKPTKCSMISSRQFDDHVDTEDAIKEWK